MSFYSKQAISFMYALIFKSISYSITSVSIHILILDTKKELYTCLYKWKWTYYYLWAWLCNHNNLYNNLGYNPFKYKEHLYPKQNKYHVEPACSLHWNLQYFLKFKFNVLFNKDHMHTYILTIQVHIDIALILIGKF